MAETTTEASATTTSWTDRLPSRRTVLDNGVWVLLAVVLVVGFVTTPAFRTPDNFVNMVRSVSLVGVAALGMSWILLVGSLVDLSVATTVSISAVIVLALSGVSVAVGVLAAVVVGAALGWINGALISRFTANPILLTLATTTIAGGALLVATNSRVTYVEGTTLDTLVNGRVFGLPATVLVLVVLTAATQYVQSRTTWGQRVLAVGGNERTALYAGIDVAGTRRQVFALTGVFAALTGVLLGGSLGSATPTAGAGYEFDALTAAVVGGCRLTGGKGTAIGVFAGAVLVGALSNLLILSGAPFALQQVVKGLLLVAVVALAQRGGNHGR